MILQGLKRDKMKITPLEGTKIKKWCLLPLVSQQIVHLETYCLRLLRQKPYILRPYNLSC